MTWRASTPRNKTLSWPPNESLRWHRGTITTKQPCTFTHIPSSHPTVEKTTHFILRPIERGSAVFGRFEKRRGLMSDACPQSRRESEGTRGRKRGRRESVCVGSV